MKCFTLGQFSRGRTLARSKKTRAQFSLHLYKKLVNQLDILCDTYTHIT